MYLVFIYYAYVYNVLHFILNKSITKTILGYRAISDFAQDGLRKSFSHILTTASSKSVVLVSNIGGRGPPFYMYTFDLYQHSHPPFLKMAITNDPIYHDLRHLEQ